MAYNHAQILHALASRLNERPFQSSRRIAADLRIARDTVCRALKIGGTTFSELRREAIERHLNALVGDSGRPMSAKEVANLLGCSSRSLLRWRRRLTVVAPGVSGIPAGAHQPLVPATDGLSTIEPPE